MKLLALALATAMATGCWHGTVTTSATPATTVIDKPFQNSYVFGLVPPTEVNTQEQCPNGVARVETEHSLANAVVSLLTAYIYTPTHIKVTCATR
jgi:hypothetical protein